MNKNERFSAAVSILRNELSQDSAKIIRYSIGQPYSSEILLRRVGLGIAIRNLLAENEILWEEVVDFDVWVSILMKSVCVSSGAPPALTRGKG